MKKILGEIDKTTYTNVEDLKQLLLMQKQLIIVIRQHKKKLIKR